MRGDLLPDTSTLPLRAERTRSRFDSAAPWIAGGVLLVYVAVALRVIAAKPLWHDEIFTIYMCRLPDLASVWRELATGLEQMPPFSHVVSRAAYALAGGDAFAIRLPAVLGFAAMVLSIYVFLARSVPAIFAALGMLVPFFTGAMHFGYEGRSYGVVLGCAGVACLAWQAAEGKRRRLALATLALACAAAIASHYYAVLILLPFALGEFARTVERRRVDWGVWAALAVSLVPLAFFVPLIRAARGYAHVFWARPGPSSVQEAYVKLLGPGLPVFVALVLVWFAYRAFGGSAEVKLKRSELALAGGFLLIPFALAAVSFLTGVFEPRYAIWGVIGLGLAAGQGAFAASNGSRRFAACAVALLVVAFLAAQAFELRHTHRQPEALANVEPLMREGLPVVYADPLRYLEAAYYASPSINRRLVYVTDPEIALRRAGTDSPERALLLLARIAPLHLETLAAFVSRNPRFLVLESGDFGWLIPELIARGALVRLRAPAADVRTYEVLLNAGGAR